MVNQKKFITLVFGIIAVVMAIVCSLLFTQAVQKDFDSSIGHFAQGSVLMTASFAIMVAGAVIGIIPAFLVKGVCVDTKAGAGISVSFVSVFAGALLLASSVFGFADPGVTLPEKYSFLTTLAGVFGCIGAASMLLFAMQGAYRSKMAKLFSMFIPLYFIIRVLELYFDTSDAFNSTTKLVSQLVFVAFSLMSTFDCGLYLERPVLGKLIFGCIVSVVMGAPLGVASLVTQFTNPGSFALSVVDTCMITGFSLLAAIKLYHIAMSFKLCEEAECDGTDEAVAEAESDTATDVKDAEEADEQ
ncbi:MAG: hypothetical protein IJ389_04150 [Clostridia bacterium]|nr:hypothetical protein [Clostridia bacterium]